MNLEQILAFIYTFLGAVTGYVSSIFNSLQFAVLTPIVIYIISFVFLLRFCKNKKLPWIISNSLIVFILIWLMVWILSCNLMEGTLCSKELITQAS